MNHISSTTEFKLSVMSFDMLKFCSKLPAIDIPDASQIINDSEQLNNYKKLFIKKYGDAVIRFTKIGTRYVSEIANNESYTKMCNDYFKSKTVWVLNYGSE